MKMESTERMTTATELENKKRSFYDKEKCNKILRRRVPIVDWLPKYKTSYFAQDALAGITVGLTAIPQGIAYAVVAGLQPQYGLYSGLMGCFVYLILGSCKDVNIGPTAIMALMIQPHVEKLGPDIAVLACFLTGCVVCLLGILQLGFLVDFISFPVVSGFTSAAALTIGSSQIKGLFGLPGKSNEFLESWIGLFGHITEIKIGDTILAIGSICFLVLAKYIGKFGGQRNDPEASRGRNILRKIVWMISLSRNAIIVIFGTILAWVFSNYGMTPFKLTGNVGVGLPPLQLPPFSTVHNNHTYYFEDMAGQLGTTIIFMPLVAILESIAITKAFSKGKSVDATQELIALGFCNIFGSFISSMSVTGSFTRTALNNASGVKTTLGGVFTALTVLLALELLTSAFYFIPKATLSAVIICAMIYMLELDVVVVLWKTRKSELLLFIITLVASLLLGVEYGILIGIAFNLLFILYASARPPVQLEKKPLGETGYELKNFFVVTPKQRLHFPAAEYIREKVVAECPEEEHIDVIVDGTYVTDIDITVAKNLKILVEDLRVRGQQIIFWNFRDKIRTCCVKIDPKFEEVFMEGSLETVITKAIPPTLEIQR